VLVDDLMEDDRRFSAATVVMIASVSCRSERSRPNQTVGKGRREMARLANARERSCETSFFPCWKTARAVSRDLDAAWSSGIKRSRVRLHRAVRRDRVRRASSREKVRHSRCSTFASAMTTRQCDCHLALTLNANRVNVRLTDDTGEFN